MTWTSGAVVTGADVGPVVPRRVGVGVVLGPASGHGVESDRAVARRTGAAVAVAFAVVSTEAVGLSICGGVDENRSSASSAGVAALVPVAILVADTCAAPPKTAAPTAKQASGMTISHKPATAKVQRVCRPPVIISSEFLPLVRGGVKYGT